jgi:hypothetical protein
VEAIENVRKDELRLGRTPVRPRCCDSVKKEGPVPMCVPGAFTMRLGDIMPAYVMEELEQEITKLGGAGRTAGVGTGWLR